MALGRRVSLKRRLLLRGRLRLLLLIRVCEELGIGSYVVSVWKVGLSLNE